MIRLTKKFHFEMAHAIWGYEGACKHIHGHSYELHVTLCASDSHPSFIPAPGFMIDFKDIKKIVTSEIINQLDHKLVLSTSYLKDHPHLITEENLVSWPMEPTAENILLFTAQTLSAILPENIQLVYMKLYETKNSYAEWISDNLAIKQSH